MKHTALHGLIAIDLFAGCGGMTLGLKQAGFQVVAAVEIDTLAVETYRLNHPKTDVYECDIREIPDSCVRQSFPYGVDVLAACPPCQGFSSVRTRNGHILEDDQRNDLIFEVSRFARVLNPKVILFENVPGLSADKRLIDLVRKLRAMKYYVDFCIEDAADYGVPQRRKRLLLAASRLAPLSLSRKPSAAPVTVREAISVLPRVGTGCDPLHDYSESRSLRIRKMIAAIPKDGGSRSTLAIEDQLACHQRSDGFSDVYGRMFWDRISPTITGGCINPSRGRFLHPTENRAITLREAALLQSFPHGYRFSMRGGRYRVAQMIGNALPPRLIRCHARDIKRHLSSYATTSTSG